MRALLGDPPASGHRRGQKKQTKGKARRENPAASAAMPGMVQGLRSSQRLSGTPPATRGVALTFPPCLRTRHVLDDLCEQPPLQSVGRPFDAAVVSVTTTLSPGARTAGYTRPQGRPPLDIRSPSAAPAGLAVGFGPKESSPTPANRRFYPWRSLPPFGSPLSSRRLGVAAFSRHSTVYAPESWLSNRGRGRQHVHRSRLRTLAGLPSPLRVLMDHSPLCHALHVS